MAPGPTFLGIGAPKCGTTWLYAQLKGHPDVWLTPIKELHYFDRGAAYVSPSQLADASPWARLASPAGWRRHRVAQSLGRMGQAALQGRPEDAAFWRRMVFGRYDDDWYRGLFAPAAGYAARGEITPAYCMLGRDDARRVRAIAPEVRLVYLMRDPVERAWSSLRYNAGRGKIALDLSDVPAVLDAIAGDASDLRGGRGDYLKTLDVFAEVFDPSQILVGFYDAIAAEPGALLSAVAGHIGVSPDGFAARGDKRVNSSRARDMPPEVRAALVEKYLPQIEGVIARLGGRARAWKSGAAPEGPVAVTLGQAPRPLSA